MNTTFKLHYPNIDLITQKLSRLGPGCHVFKVDLSRAFRQLFVDPKDLDLLCLYWHDSYFVGSCSVIGMVPCSLPDLQTISMML